MHRCNTFTMIQLSSQLFCSYNEYYLLGPFNVTSRGSFGEPREPGGLRSVGWCWIRWWVAAKWWWYSWGAGGCINGWRKIGPDEPFVVRSISDSWGGLWRLIIAAESLLSGDDESEGDARDGELQPHFIRSGDFSRDGSGGYLLRKDSRLAYRMKRYEVT